MQAVKILIGKKQKKFFFSSISTSPTNTDFASSTRWSSPLNIMSNGHFYRSGPFQSFALFWRFYYMVTFKKKFIPFYVQFYAWKVFIIIKFVDSVYCCCRCVICCSYTLRLFRWYFNLDDTVVRTLKHFDIVPP